ncbi:hypothetical protein PYH37_000673 [Sinorhizobium numidicum]|uniref:Uncharacterized protein n=1 Tax=Sinorhizobium numidicum TaxID=680248 RepID=A0ABY8CVJ7_9HYPH|nr:hypothetical protein [Sinorhizobium numidicum]WEX75283.1 hypothetical protein PYH37_000673 [Sinorhizobium numidicum]WEX81278.1 hypothetical protein PYH38_000675 [Sinorhizobium numidicum]
MSCAAVVLRGSDNAQREKHCSEWSAGRHDERRSLVSLGAASRQVFVASPECNQSLGPWRSAARADRLDIPHTGVGVLTHYLACCFWAVLFTFLLDRQHSNSPLNTAIFTASMAAFVDYFDRAAAKPVLALSAWQPAWRSAEGSTL